MMETIEIIKEARKAGMQTAFLMFGALIIVSFLFGYYIYKSYDITNISMSAVQDGNENKLEQNNGEAIY